MLYAMVALALRRVYPLHAHVSFLLLTFAFSTFNVRYLQEQEQHTGAAAAPQEALLPTAAVRAFGSTHSAPMREKAL